MRTLPKMRMKFDTASNPEIIWRDVQSDVTIGKMSKRSICRIPGLTWARLASATAFGMRSRTPIHVTTCWIGRGEQRPRALCVLKLLDDSLSGAYPPNRETGDESVVGVAHRHGRGGTRFRRRGRSDDRYRRAQCSDSGGKR
jgi:hypothetical protein